MHTRFVVGVSDTHLGDQLALCPPAGVALDDGGWYTPSPIQQQLSAYWHHTFDVWLPGIVGDEPWALVHNGDVVEGDHHNSWTPISRNPEIQAAAALEVLEPIVARAKAGFYVVRGTPAHAGQSACSEEGIAKALGAIGPVKDRYSWDHLKLRFGEGHLSDWMHHISGSGNGRTKANALQAELHDVAYAAGLSGIEVPDIVIRSHRHNYTEMGVKAKPDATGLAKTIRGVTTPSWQAKNGHCFKAQVARNSVPEFGAICLESTKHGINIHSIVWQIQDTQEVCAA